MRFEVSIDRFWLRSMWSFPEPSRREAREEVWGRECSVAFSALKFQMRGKWGEGAHLSFALAPLPAHPKFRALKTPRKRLLRRLAWMCPCHRSRHREGVRGIDHLVVFLSHQCITFCIGGGETIGDLNRSLRSRYFECASNKQVAYVFVAFE